MFARRSSSTLMRFTSHTKAISACRMASANSKKAEKPPPPTPSKVMCPPTSLYAHQKVGAFAQEAPKLRNPFVEDPVLERFLRKIMPTEIYNSTAEDLFKFGERIVNEIEALGREAEISQPRLEQYDAWGNRVDNLIVSPAWFRLKEICAEEGLVALGYDEGKDAEMRRVHQFAKLFLFSPSAGLVTCPMAMTDGAAKTIKELGLMKGFPEAAEAYKKLVSRNPSEAWTSGQWMTEKKGGSDVGSGCDTFAVCQEGNNYVLNGYKWFSSAVDADMALALARVVDSNGQIIQGSKGLSLFFVRMRDAASKKLNGIQMVRLKNKLGTKQLPTAELILDGTKAIKLCDDGKGVASISHMLNITRVHNAIASVAGMRRVLSLARDYATRRIVFGRLQVEWPLHLATLSKLEVETRGCLLLTIETARLLGLQESGRATPRDQVVLRLLTPVTKMYVGKKCVPLISECLECFGGQGYIEDTGIPTLLRDAQVTPIWEGTTNVLALDVLRVFSGKNTVLKSLREQIESILAPCDVSKSIELAECKRAILSAVRVLEQTVALLSQKNAHKPMEFERAARDIAFIIARTYAGTLLTALAADKVGTPSDAVAAYRFCVEQRLSDVNPDDYLVSRTSVDKSLIYENFDRGESKL